MRLKRLQILTVTNLSLQKKNQFQLDIKLNLFSTPVIVQLSCCNCFHFTLTQFACDNVIYYHLRMHLACFSKSNLFMLQISLHVSLLWNTARSSRKLPRFYIHRCALLRFLDFSERKFLSVLLAIIFNKLLEIR